MPPGRSAGGGPPTRSCTTGPLLIAAHAAPLGRSHDRFNHSRGRSRDSRVPAPRCLRLGQGVENAPGFLPRSTSRPSNINALAGFRLGNFRPACPCGLVSTFGGTAVSEKEEKKRIIHAHRQGNKVHVLAHRIVFRRRAPWRRKAAAAVTPRGPDDLRSARSSPAPSQLTAIVGAMNCPGPSEQTSPCSGFGSTGAGGNLRFRGLDGFCVSPDILLPRGRRKKSRAMKRRSGSALAPRALFPAFLSEAGHAGRSCLLVPTERWENGRWPFPAI